MNIIIPLGGKGDRFFKEGYHQPKPLIPVFGKPMILHLLDRLYLTPNDHVYIFYHRILDDYNFSEIIANHRNNNFHCIPIPYQTRGATETILYGLTIYGIEQFGGRPCALFDCDTFYTVDILKQIRESSNKNIVFYTKKPTTTPPIYSYIEIDESANNNNIIRIREKEKISNNANTGCYVFETAASLHAGAKYILDNAITVNGEPYTSCVISYLLETERRHKFTAIELKTSQVVSLGTPKELKEYIEQSYVFLFDLDGTLVKTDTIYFEVWREILKPYNIELTPELFSRYIHGNTDTNVVSTFLLSCPNVEEISREKDRLFCENLEKIGIVDGAIGFLKQIRENGHYAAIVTNCNRQVAESICDWCGFFSYIDFITVGNECSNEKPHPDPYLESMRKYDSKNAIIFEDSKSGLLSGRLSNPHCLIGITTEYNSDELIRNGADMTIDNYLNFDCQEAIRFHKNTSTTVDKLKKSIRTSLRWQIEEIEIDETKLKGGYISDVISLTIRTTEKTYSCVLKLENKTETNLSHMAKKLGLYERENYFYDAISRYVNIGVPEFYGLIKDEQLNTIGILMENMLTSGAYTLNLDLNREPIETSLKVIEQLAKFHAKHWNKNIQNAYPALRKNDDSLFRPVWSNFILEKWPKFAENWRSILKPEQFQKAESICRNFSDIQFRLSQSPLTMIHGDVKSPNLFYHNQTKMPVFLDWQYIAIGKGVQDVIFFLIESFDLEHIRLYYPIFKGYYYSKLREYGVTGYEYSQYCKDIEDSIQYFPFFVAIWFGTTHTDELIDKNFPFFFIQKLFALL